MLLLRSLAALCLALAAEASAYAYETGTLVGSECHENLTRRALADAREALSIESPDFPSDIDREALLSDLDFEVDERDRFDTVATTLANREVDLGGLEPGEIARLTQIHGAEENQREHCLRRSSEDEPNGSELALEECRGLIREQMMVAFDGLDTEGRPNVDDRVTMKTYLLVRGSVEIALPRFYVGLGRALHALQDGFSHSYRSEDGTRVTTVLNWAELVEAELDPAIDGPAHSGHLDECANLDPVRDLRWMHANDASTELATIALDRTLDRDEKERAVDDLLERYVAFQPGCTAANGWCDAPEAGNDDPEACACRSTKTSGSWWWLLGVPLLLILRKRAAPLLALSAVLLLASPRRAEASDFGLYVSGSAAVMNAAFATSIGARYSLTKNWELGLDAEWNPWIGGALDKVRAGSVNAYATIIFKIPMRYESVNLRSTLQLGASRIMFDLVGVAEGSIGPYVGVNVLGVEWAFAEDLYLVIDPAHISLPIPQVQGVPFIYPQYRVTLGLQWGG